MKNYLIIGGSSGIGKSLTNILAASGHQIYATYNKHPQASWMTGQIIHFDGGMSSIK